MTESDEEEMNEVRARLKQSREEISHLLDPPRDPSGALPPAGGQSGFPRSRTMQMLMSNRGLGALGVLAGGFLMARPGLAFRLLRLLPTGTVAKAIIARALSALSDRAD
ncbi:MAG TPA: hypothetical protein VGI65_18315 [Steroidobacteraceae bacterium]|jgi:hypothetical protein